MIPFNIITHYSVQQSFVRIKPLVKRAVELDLKSLCITDYNSLSGCVEFLQECKKNNIKPILGCTINMEDDTQGILLARNKDGWYNLIKIVGRILYEDQKLYSKWETLSKYSENLIFISDNEIFLDKVNKFSKNVFSYNFDYKDFKRIDGNKILYINEDEKIYQEIITCSRLKITLDDFHLLDYNFDNNYLMYNERFDNSDILDELCETYDIMENPKYPIFNVDDPDEEMTKLCRIGWKNKVLDKIRNNDKLREVYTDRIKYELGVFKKAKLANYILIIRDIIMFARNNNISVGLRGSASGCLISYLLDISDIDPVIPDPTLEYDPNKSLSFDRFFNQGRLNLGKVSFNEYPYEDFIK